MSNLNGTAFIPILAMLVFAAAAGVWAITSQNVAQAAS